MVDLGERTTPKEVPDGYRMTELGLLPDDWSVVQLNDVVSIYDKSRIPLNSEQRCKMQGIYPYYGANGVVDHINAYIFEGEHVLVAEDGGYWGPHEATAYVVEGRFWVNNHAHVLCALEGYTTNAFLANILNYMDISAYISGTTRGKLNQGVLRDIRIPLPPLPEQRAIAHVLSTVQRAREATEVVIAATRELKRSLMRHLFTYGPVPVDQVQSMQFKDTEIGSIPRQWEAVPLGTVITLQRGFDLPKQHRRDGPIPVVSSSGITGTHAVPKVRAPGVVIGRYGTLGQAFFIQTDFWPLNTTLFVKDFKGNEPAFVADLLRTLDYQPHNDKTSIPGVNRNHLHAVTVALPPIDEQVEILRISSAIESKLIAELERASLLSSLFRTLLQGLMTGEARVSAHRIWVTER